MKKQHFTLIGEQGNTAAVTDTLVDTYGLEKALDIVKGFQTQTIGTMPLFETVIDKLEVLFPNCQVWMLECHQNHDYFFELTALDNKMYFSFDKAVHVSTILFDLKNITVYVKPEIFTKEEQKQLAYLQTLDLRDFNHFEMKVLLFESFQENNSSENS